MEEGGLELGYPLLSDPGGAVARAYGLYDPEHEAALPATIIVSPSGTVAWKRVGEAISDRPTEAEIVATLEKPAPSPLRT